MELRVQRELETICSKLVLLEKTSLESLRNENRVCFNESGGTLHPCLVTMRREVRSFIPEFIFFDKKPRLLPVIS